MPLDLPDFHIPGKVFPIRDWGSKTGVQRIEFFNTAQPVEPGASVTTGWKIQPEGKKFYICDTWQSFQSKARMEESTEGFGLIMRSFSEAYTCSETDWTVPMPIPPGEKWKIDIYNEDTVSGHTSLRVSGWEEPASPWPTPKKGDPIERWNLAYYNRAIHHLLPNGEKIVIFKRDDEDIISSVHIENLGTDKQKVVASSFLTEKEREEVVKTIGKKPEKVREMIKKYGKKYSQRST